MMRGISPQGRHLAARTRWAALVIGLIVLLTAGAARAFTHFSPSPQGNVGVSRPPLVQRFNLYDASFGSAEARLDGVKVPLTWDAASGYLYYVPPAPLAPGTHHVELVVHLKALKAGYHFDPYQESYDFTVVPGAYDQLPAPSAEGRLALACLNLVRAEAGLPAFAFDAALCAAASAHAAYLAVDPWGDAHNEEIGHAAFKGVRPSDRAAYFGYYAGVGEVVAWEDGAEKAVSGWLSTLYHRLPLMDPDNRLLGYGMAIAEKPANVIDCGPAWPLSGGGGGTTGGGGQGSGSLTRVRYPYDGQTGVPTYWPGAERPDPLRLYPGVTGPLGYTVTLSFPGAGDPVLSQASLTAASGSPVDVMRYDATMDDRLVYWSTVALIPRQPLAPNTVYTAHFAGTVDGSAFDETWSFTTGPGLIEIGPEGSWRWSCQGDRVEVTLVGISVRQGLAAFLGDLPVRELNVSTSRTGFSFRLPVGFEGGARPLTLAGSDGSELTLTTDTGFPAGPAPADELWSAVAPPFPFAREALRHQDGTVMVPASCLNRLGAAGETIPGLPARTDWLVGGHLGTVTLGSSLAYIDGRLLQLPLPVQTLDGETYVPAEFVAALSAALSQFTDMASHWARDDVARLVSLGIVAGMGDGTFRPAANLTRAAFVKMLVLALGLEPGLGDTGGFPDTAGHWVSAQGYIGPAVTAGIVRPAEYPGGLFEPNRNITREEIAVMVVRAMGLEDEALAQAAAGGGSAAVFADVGQCRYPGHVAVAVDEKMIYGYDVSGTKTFRPAGPATRAEAAVIVNRLLGWLQPQ